MVTPLDVYDPEVIRAQLNPPPLAALYRADYALITVLIAQAEHVAAGLGHDITLDRVNKTEAVGWCPVCGWSAAIDTRAVEDDPVFNGSALEYACAGEKVALPWSR